MNERLTGFSSPVLVGFFHILPCFDRFLTFISGHKNSISKICVDLSLHSRIYYINFILSCIFSNTMRPCHEGIQLNFFYFHKGLKSWETGGKAGCIEIFFSEFWIETSKKTGKSIHAQFLVHVQKAKRKKKIKLM